MIDSKTKAGGRYVLRVNIAIAIYVVVLLAVELSAQPTGLARYLVAVLPAIPLLAIIAFVAQYLREEKDEFVRTEVTIALLGGIGLTLAFATVWGFLETFAGIPRLPLWSVFPIFAGVSGLLQPLVRWWFR
jgi:hypothetical protein